AGDVRPDEVDWPFEYRILERGEASDFRDVEVDACPKRAAIEQHHASETCTAEIRTAHESAALELNLARDLRIFEVDRPVNDCANDSHALSMQFEVRQRAH